MEHHQNFTGTINRTAPESTIAWTSEPSPLRQRPNIVMIVLDDVGYAEFGCYGSDIETPALDSLATDGLRYADFHVTPLCSPTRTCLLIGRNHHSVGMGRVAEIVSGFPNTRGFASREAANLAEMLRPHGYQTLAAGKWHLGCIHETSPAGPYDHWPLQRGFDRFHGFMPGETNQWNPELITGNERVEPSKKEGYHLSEDIVDQSRKWLRQLVSADPDRPFFLYVAFAAGHSPHHVPASYVNKYKGRFDGGWDAARERILARQKASGLLPEDQRLASRNPGVQVWDELDADEKRLAARLMEVYAGFLDHADKQISRLLAQVDALGKRDDTIVIAISDNGASPLGGPHGTYDHQRPRNGIGTSVEENLARLDDMGEPLHLQPLPVRLGHGRQHPVQALQGQHLRGRCPRAPADPLARRDSGEGRDPPAVLPRGGRHTHVGGPARSATTDAGQRRGTDSPARAARGVYGPHLPRPSCVIVGRTEDRGDGERMLGQPLHSKPAHQPVGSERSPSIKVRNSIARTTG